MKKLRGLSVILCLTMILSVLNFPVYADSTVKAYITISMEGEIVKDKYGEYVAEAPVVLSGKDSFTLDDVFKEAHDLYYDGGADAGYATTTSEWGPSVAKVWGDNSGKFGYQMNLGAVSVWGPTQTVNDGDYIDLCVYENYYPQTESYAKFDAYQKNIDGDTAELTLYESYYGEYWETLFKPCESATVLIDGVATAITTDTNGKCTLSFDESGEHMISARKTKTVKNAVTNEDETVLAITAPICHLKVTLPNELAVIHNAVNKFTKDSLSEQDQMYWLLCDIAGYNELYPNNQRPVSEADKQKCIDKIIPAAETATSASDLAKAILALRSMGYDPENTYDSVGTKVDIVAKLSAFIDEQSGGVTSIYSLPYIIMAMRGYASDEQMTTLLTAVLNQKDGEYGWLDNSWGVDGATPMLCALAPYCDENAAVKSAVSEAVEKIQEKQSDSGAIVCLDWNTYGWVDSAASTGLAIAGLSAVGIDPETVQKNGKSLIDGLMSLKTAENDGFLASSFDTEQGLRGLIAWQLYKNGKRIFDFSGYSKNTAYATRISIAHSGGGTVAEKKTEEEETIKVTVKVMAHNENECDNSYTYKDNSSKYKAIVSKTVEISKNGTVYDATVEALLESGTPYEDRSGYIASIGDFAEFDHGGNSGWMFLLNGKHQNSGCKEIALNQNATVVWFYTDDYTRESGSEHYLSGGETSAEKEVAENAENDENKPQTRVFESNTFSDVKESDWHFGAVKFVYENNLMSGTDKGFEPDGKMTRAMLVSVLFRLSGETAVDTDENFSDVKSGEWYTDAVLWAASVGIVSGIGDNLFAPDSEITREQMAVILYNFAVYKNADGLAAQSDKIGEFEDFNEISDYAKTALSWANAEGFITGESETVLNPKNSATRAQIASILMRYCGAE